MRWKCHGSVQATGNSPDPSLSPPLEQSGNQTRWADNSDQYVGFEIGSACCDNTSEWFPTQTDCLLVRILTQFTYTFALYKRMHRSALLLGTNVWYGFWHVNKSLGNQLPDS